MFDTIINNIILPYFLWIVIGVAIIYGLLSQRLTNKRIGELRCIRCGNRLANQTAKTKSMCSECSIKIGDVPLPVGNGGGR